MSKKLDILFVHPNASNKIYQGLGKDLSAIEPPIWAMMLSKYIQKKGYSVSLLDCEAERLNYAESFSRIKEINPKIVCLVVYGQQPSASTQNMVGAMGLMQLIHENTDIIRIYTGPHPSALPTRTIQDDPDVFVCKGEGVKTLEDFLKVTDYTDYTQLSKVRGLCYKNKDTGAIVEALQPAILTDLDNELEMLPLEFIDIKKYRTANWHSWTNNNETQPFASIYTSLGCPMKCTFCMINSPFNQGDTKNNTFRNWKPSNIIKKFDELAFLGVKNIKIADEMFVLKKDHFLELCKLIIERKYGFNIWAYARIDTVREEYLDALKSAGVNWLGLGVESGNKTVRQEVTKGKFQELNIRDIVGKISNHGISCGANYIFGLPTDTLETMQETLDLALELKTEYANLYCAMAYPGSQLHRDFSKDNPSVLPENSGVGWIGYSQHAYETYNLPTKTLKNSEILAFREKAFHTFFTNKGYREKMYLKFGSKFDTEIDKMLAIKLKRKILDD
jgi:radical SAM superfamily enzyme YgiQ (UPF0313 family)